MAFLMKVLCYVGMMAVTCWSVINTAPAILSREYDEKFDVPSPQYDLFEGDIAGIDLQKAASTGSLRAAHIGMSRNAISDPFFRWSKGIVPYVISELFHANETAKIKAAIDDINNITKGVRLTPAKRGDRDYVYIARGQPKTGCWSYVGVIGGPQTVNLEAAVRPGDAHCLHHGIIQHELLHAIGLWHEQSRSDRDLSVEVNWANIPPEQQHNFEFYDEEFVTAFGQPYDFDSLMHYGQFDFAINKSIWTLRPRTPWRNRSIGQRKGLSSTDIAKLDLMYPLRVKTAGAS